MATLELRTSGRQYRRQFLTAIRGNLIRALTELITNSDDSYRRRGDTGRPGFGTIQIFYERKHRRLSVIDWAEGMDANDMQQMYPNYGSATSGLYQDQSVRGYFGKGLKDVMFSMQNGLVQSIKQGRLYTARFIWKESLPLIEIDAAPQAATPEVRARLGIPHGNGTRVSFTIPETMNLPRHESLLKNLSNYYMLRLILSSESRRILLCTRQGNRSYENLVRYRFPTGDRLLAESFQLEYRLPILADMQLYRSQTPLTQFGEEREGGLLIYDDQAAVLDLTLFQYDREEHAARLFGWIELHNFRELLKAEENVLTDTRDGLDRHHPFTQVLAEAVESRLRPVVEHERHAHLQDSPGELSRKQRRRLGNSIDHINRLLGNLSSLRWGLGDENGHGFDIPPEAGLEFSPKSISLHRRNRTAVRLRIDTSQVPAGSKVVIASDSNRISYKPKTFKVQADPGRLVVTQTVMLSGWQVGETARLEARYGDFLASLQARVVAQDYPMPEGGFAFIPGVLRLTDNTSRRARLFIHESVARAGDTLHLQGDNPQIELGRTQMVLQADDFKNGIAALEVTLKGTGIGEKALLTASTGSHQATLPVEVVSRSEKRPRGPVLVTGYRFDRTTPSRVRASYDQETGLIWIYLKNPIVERYFGNLPLEVALNAPHCQILLAEILLEQVAWIARRKMIESGAAMYVGDNPVEEDLEAVRRFVAEYGDKIHSWIADDRIIAQAVESVTHDISIRRAAPVQPSQAVSPDVEIHKALSSQPSKPAVPASPRRSIFGLIAQIAAAIQSILSGVG